MKAIFVTWHCGLFASTDHFSRLLTNSQEILSYLLENYYRSPPYMKYVLFTLPALKDHINFQYETNSKLYTSGVLYILVAKHLNDSSLWPLHKDKWQANFRLTICFHFPLSSSLRTTFRSKYIIFLQLSYPLILSCVTYCCPSHRNIPTAN